MSGDDVFSGFGTFDIATDDVYRVADFGHLEEALREAAFGLRAVADGAQARRLHADPGTNDLVPAPDWDMTTTVDPIPTDWVPPATGVGSTATWPPTRAGSRRSSGRRRRRGPSRACWSPRRTRRRPAGLRQRPSATTCVVRTPTRRAMSRSRSRRRRTGSERRSRMSRSRPARWSIACRRSRRFRLRRRPTEATPTCRPDLHPDRRPDHLDISRDQHRQRHALQSRGHRRPGRGGGVPAGVARPGPRWSARRVAWRSGAYANVGTVSGVDRSGRP